MGNQFWKKIQKNKEKPKHKTHPYLESWQKDYRGSAWATGIGGKVVEVAQERRQFGGLRHVQDELKILDPAEHFAILCPAAQKEDDEGKIAGSHHLVLTELKEVYY